MVKKLFNLLNPDQSTKAYSDGEKDALAGKDRNYIRMAASPKTLLHGNAAMDSYKSDYDKGYDGGTAKKNEVYYKDSNIASGPDDGPVSGGNTDAVTAKNDHGKGYDGATAKQHEVYYMNSNIASGQGGGAAIGSSEAITDFAETVSRTAWDILSATEALSNEIRARQSTNEWDDQNYTEFAERFAQLQQFVAEMTEGHMNKEMTQTLRGHAERLRAIVQG